MTNDETGSGLPFCPGFCIHHSAFVIPTGLAYFPVSSPRSFFSASAAPDCQGLMVPGNVTTQLRDSGKRCRSRSILAFT